jgi:hypothetical protein
MRMENASEQNRGDRDTRGHLPEHGRLALSVTFFARSKSHLADGFAAWTVSAG